MVKIANDDSYKFYKIAVKPTILYAFEYWAVKKQHIKRQFVLRK